MFFSVSEIRVYTGGNFFGMEIQDVLNFRLILRKNSNCLPKFEFSLLGSGEQDEPYALIRGAFQYFTQFILRFLQEIEKSHDGGLYSYFLMFNGKIFLVSLEINEGVVQKASSEGLGGGISALVEYRRRQLSS